MPRVEQELVDLCRSKGCGWWGPNCLGVLNTDHHMNATFAPSVPLPARFPSCPSPAPCACDSRLGASQKLGLGNGHQLRQQGRPQRSGFHPGLAEDKETKVIAGYLESIKEGDKFLRIAEQAAGSSRGHSGR